MFLFAWTAIGKWVAGGQLLRPFGPEILPETGAQEKTREGDGMGGSERVNPERERKEKKKTGQSQWVNRPEMGIFGPKLKCPGILTGVYLDWFMWLILMKR